MNNKPFKACLLIAFLLAFASCKKNLETNSPSAISMANANYSSEDLAATLKQDFGLRDLTTQEADGIQFLQFDNYSDAAAYIQDMQYKMRPSPNFYSNVSSGTVESLEMTDNYSNKTAAAPDNFPDPNYPCGKSGLYHTTLHSSGGFFSNFNTYFTTNGSAITSTNVYVSGVSIGWSWNQLVTTFNGTANSGCIGGTITYGIQVGSATIGVVAPYHFDFNFDPSTCTLTWSQSGGPC